MGSIERPLNLKTVNLKSHLCWSSFSIMGKKTLANQKFDDYPEYHNISVIISNKILRMMETDTSSSLKPSIHYYLFHHGSLSPI